ncbi:MAG: class I SAM-dependent rRNA methyltransferase [Deltaproteobacteria bacterium]|nr:class I SAM-dependent rRNA methyltransferase [Deltaproteobacteria bacterium]
MSFHRVDLIRAAATRRASGAPGWKQTGYRVLNGPGDGGPAGLAIDRYGDWLVVLAREEVAEVEVEGFVAASLEALQPKGLVLKRIPRTGEVSSELRLGDPRPIVVEEDDARFVCDLGEGLATGLYLDQHESRRRIRRHVLGEALNLFAYTCSFSVHAALAGASRVTSVDASRRALRRGAENMVESGLEASKHAFVTDDVESYLSRAARKRTSFGLVILDPPAFGRAGNRTMSLERDLERLICASSLVVSPGGVLVVSVHAKRLGLERLRKALGGTGRRVEELGEFGLPAWDHPTSNHDHPDDRGDYLKVLDVRLW